MRFSAIAAFSLTSLVLVAGCTSPFTGSKPDSPSAVVLLLGKKIVAVNAGETEEIPVVARDADLNLVPFTATTADACLTVAATASSIAVGGPTSGCRGTVTVTAPAIGVTKEIHVNVQDPLAMDIGDGLLIRYVNDYQWRWHDAGSGGDNDIGFFHPIVPADYHALGSFIRASGDGASARQTPTIVVKDSGTMGALAAPTGYTYIWNDGGSGADNDGSVWLPTCPPGFVALGVVTQTGYGEPSKDDVRCVKERYAVRGSVGSFVTNDQGSGANDDLGVWNIEPPLALPGKEKRLPFPVPGLQVACAGYAQECTGQLAAVHILMLPVEPLEAADNADAEPRLTGYRPLEENVPRYYSSVRLPFTLIPSVATGNMDFKVGQTPFYTVHRVEAYTTLPDGIVDNRQGSNPIHKTWQVTTGISKSQTDTFSLEIGLKVTTEGSAEFAGVGSKTSVEMSSTFKWETSTTSTYSQETTTTTEFDIPAHAYAQIVQVRTQFVAQDAFGAMLPARIDGGSSIVKYLEYSPEA